MKQVTATIDANGKVVLDVAGVSGRACLDLTRDLERALGVVTDRTAKPEMHRQQEGQNASARAGGHHS